MSFIINRNIYHYSDLHNHFNNIGLPANIHEEEVIFSVYDFGKKNISFCQRYNASLLIEKKFIKAILGTFSSYIYAKTNAEVVQFYFRKKLETTPHNEIYCVGNKGAQPFTEAIQNTYYQPNSAKIIKDDLDRTLTIAKNYFSSIFSPESISSIGNRIIVTQDIRRSSLGSDLLSAYARGSSFKSREQISNNAIEQMFNTDVVKNHFYQRNILISTLGGNILELPKNSEENEKYISRAIQLKLNEYISKDNKSPRVPFKAE